MLLLTEQCCHQSEEARVLASEEKTMVSTRKHELTVVDSVFMYGLLLVRDGQTWLHHADDRYMVN